MAYTKPTVTFFTEDVTFANTAFWMQLGRESLNKSTRITMTVSISTPGGALIVSLMTTRATPTAIVGSCAIMANGDLLRTLRKIEQQNIRLQKRFSIMFAKAVEPLLPVPWSGEQRAFAAHFSAALSLPSPSQDTSHNTSGSSSDTASTRAAEACEAAGLDTGRVEADWVEVLRQDVHQQVLPRSLSLHLNLGKVMASSATSTHSPVPS